METHAPKAVFISYASQDAEAARRIADALRAAGVEVWFDQDALVGGDAWDQKIRSRIQDCALFVPLISASTQVRLEGYFRIEWRLAAERTHAMAAARPFLIPIVIDTTRDAEAHVPAEFKTVQWTRLPTNEATEMFVQRIQALLASGLITGVTSPLGSRPELAEQSPGDRIGHYRLLEKIGEGGCGTVWRAEQAQPVRRQVALKVIKLGMDTKEVIARFETERQVLAMMDHPNIAKVFDAGTTDTGRPFFVMELVHGVPITAFCDEKKLPTAARLELFTQVCHAVQHAHQKGIIHRDMKPSNVLVALHDDEPVPKVIDFGIAKATGGRLTDQTFFTAVEQFIGTPAYMSPEQAQVSAIDVDVRSDIYSLGVLLYELLTSRTPFDTAELLKIGLDEMRRHIREVDPPRPSNRLTTMQGEALGTAAQHRQISPPKLLSLIRGDLDWIVMRCLEKDRARRYETANGLVADIRRHLCNEPVIARPPSVLYRTKKLAGRHKSALVGAGAVVAALVAGLVLSEYIFREKTRARTNIVPKAELPVPQVGKAATAIANVALPFSTAVVAKPWSRVVDYSFGIISMVDGTLSGISFDTGQFDAGRMEARLKVSHPGDAVTASDQVSQLADRLNNSEITKYLGFDRVAFLATPFRTPKGTLEFYLDFSRKVPGRPYEYPARWENIGMLEDKRTFICTLTLWVLANSEAAKLVGISTKILVAPKNLGINVQQFYKAEHKSGTKLVTLRPLSSNLAPNWAGHAAAGFDVGIRGPYLNIIRFVEELRSAWPIADVQRCIIEDVIPRGD